MKWEGLMIAFIFLAASLNAAVVKGNVYDADTLDIAEKAIVSVDTVPAQVKVAGADGYSFEIPPGNYSITARRYAGNAPEAQENISIVDNGSYTLDLLMLPQTFLFDPEIMGDLNDSVESEIPNATATPAETGSKPDSVVAQPYNDGIAGGAFLGVAILAVIAYFVFKAPKEALPNAKRAKAKKKAEATEILKVINLTPEQKKVVSVLKSAGGFASQKDIRKEMPVSEAKVSLIITELEEMGLAKRFKRGRGNLVKLVKQ